MAARRGGIYEMDAGEGEGADEGAEDEGAEDEGTWFFKSVASLRHAPPPAPAEQRRPGRNRFAALAEDCAPAECLLGCRNPCCAKVDVREIMKGMEVHSTVQGSGSFSKLTKATKEQARGLRTQAGELLPPEAGELLPPEAGEPLPPDAGYGAAPRPLPLAAPRRSGFVGAPPRCSGIVCACSACGSARTFCTFPAGGRSSTPRPARVYEQSPQQARGLRTPRLPRQCWRRAPHLGVLLSERGLQDPSTGGGLLATIGVGEAPLRPGEKAIDVVVDSGAVASVAPKGLFPGALEPSIMSRAGRTYRAANGSPIRNFGQVRVPFVSAEGHKCSFPFQVAEVEHALLSVGHLAEAGNRVELGAKGGRIVNIATGKAMALTRRGGVYVLRLRVSGFPRPGAMKQ